MDAAGFPSGAPATVAVVGGGFSGLLTAIHLLRSDPLLRVHLIEAGRRIGPGRAFATPNPDHLLNVRAANMSAFVEDPDHFRRWLRAPTGDLFTTRGVYGDYLQEILAAECARAGYADRLTVHHGSAVSARLASDWRIALADGRVVQARALVLAMGFLSSSTPSAFGLELPEHPAIISDPWASDLSKIGHGEVLLLGTGLTMADVAMSLAAQGGRLTALSRRGLLPRAHGPAAPSPAPGVLASPLSALRRLRSHAAKVGWRTAVDSVRWLTPEVWRAWTVLERRQFLRHLQPWWDVHRHRMAPEAAARLATMQESGRLRTLAAKIQSVTPAGDHLDVAFRPRGGSEARTERFAAVINCTSPNGDVDRVGDGLVADLRGQGLLRGDALGLGLDMGRGWSVKGAGGTPTPGLYAIGPLARSAVWEAVAIPDLRRHAQEVAGSVLGYLAVDQHQPPLSAARGA